MTDDTQYTKPLIINSSQVRIDQLRVDIDHLNASIRALNDRLAGLRGLWEPQVRY